MKFQGDNGIMQLHIVQEWYEIKWIGGISK